MNGIQLPQEEKRGKTTAQISDRLNEMSATNQKRVLILRNGIGNESAEIVIPANNFQTVSFFFGQVQAFNVVELLL